MTREHKLALIVGFSLVLVLGVLISDHFSKARVVEGSEDLQPEGTRQMGATPPGIRLASETSGSTLMPLPTGGAGGAGGAGGGQAFTNAQPAAPLPNMNPTPAPAPTAAVFEIVNDPSIRRADISPDLAARTQMVPSGGIDTLPGSNQSPTPGNTVVLGPPMSTTSGLPITTGQSRRYEIKEGDSLYAIAKSTYGDGKLWEKLREFNKGRINADGAVREGVTITLPPKDILLGKAVMPDARAAATGATVLPGGGSSTPAPNRAAPTPTMIPAPTTAPNGKPVKPDSRLTSGNGAADSSGFTTYTVQKGDYLENVARKLLGSPNRWPEIVEANKAVLPDPESLKIGMTLRIPAR